MKSFKDYITANEKQYKYTAKIATADMPDGASEMLIAALEKLDLVSNDKMLVTPLQENPLDFPNIKNVAVHVLDFTIKYPSTTDVLERVVSETLGIQRGAIVVYCENDPRRVYTQQYLDRKSEDFKKKYKPAIGSMYEDEKPEKIELYGEKYNNKLLAHLAKEKKKRKDNIVINALSPKQTFDNSSNDTGLGPIGTTSPISGKNKE